MDKKKKKYLFDKQWDVVTSNKTIYNAGYNPSRGAICRRIRLASQVVQINGTSDDVTFLLTVSMKIWDIFRESIVGTNETKLGQISYSLQAIII